MRRIEGAYQLYGLFIRMPSVRLSGEGHRMISRNIVSLEHFIEAARDAGYTSISTALAELVDNAFEAEATRVEIRVETNLENEITVTIEDNGVGMTPSVLELALQFGGTTRFNSRAGTGRYGMGLPNSSLSQARRVEVVTRTNPRAAWTSYLDVDEIVTGVLKSIPKPRRITRSAVGSDSGTTVVWKKCDRITFKNERIFLERIRNALGRLFRKQLWAGKEIIVGGKKVTPIDPLFLKTNDAEAATPFGSAIEYDIDVPGTQKRTSRVTVQFVELPIEKWHALSNEQKQSKGISKSAGVSVVRAGREIDYGWFFLGKKRKENYDDWWRCEVCFDPELDEVFGVTNTKQGIRPQELLKSILSPDMEQVSHLLNSRVRTRYAAVRAEADGTAGERTASRRDHLLEPPVVNRTEEPFAEFGVPPLPVRSMTMQNPIPGLRYRFETKRIPGQSFFVPLLSEREIVVLVNENHPFYECIYSPFVRLSSQHSKLFQHLELTLLAAARAECTLSPTDKRSVIKTMREEWSKVLATFLE